MHRFSIVSEMNWIHNYLCRENGRKNITQNKFQYNGKEKEDCS
jgi:hypothetical protein